MGGRGGAALGTPRRSAWGRGTAPLSGSKGALRGEPRQNTLKGGSAYEPESGARAVPPQRLRPWLRGGRAVWLLCGPIPAPTAVQMVAEASGEMRTVAAHPVPCRCPGASPSSPLGPLSIRFSRPCRVHTFPRGSQTPGPHAAELGERLVPWGLRPCPRASVPEGSLQEVPGRPSQRCPLPSFPVSLEEGARRTRHASRPGLCFLLQPPPPELTVHTHSTALRIPRKTFSGSAEPGSYKSKAF